MCLNQAIILKVFYYLDSTLIHNHEIERKMKTISFRVPIDKDLGVVTDFISSCININIHSGTLILNPIRSDLNFCRYMKQEIEQ